MHCVWLSCFSNCKIQCILSSCIWYLVKKKNPTTGNIPGKFRIIYPVVTSTNNRSIVERTAAQLCFVLPLNKFATVLYLTDSVHMGKWQVLELLESGEISQDQWLMPEEEEEDEFWDFDDLDDFEDDDDDDDDDNYDNDDESDSPSISSSACSIHAND
jgi:hypothetical protein